MDHPNPAEAPSGAGRRNSTPGTTAGPSQGAFSGMQVSQQLTAGPFSAGTLPLVKRGSTGVGESPRSLAAREVVSTVSRLGPVPGSEPPRRPGTSLAPQGRPSAPPALQARNLEPKLPTRFKWQDVYVGIEKAAGKESRPGDPYRAAAHTSALREIDKAVMDAYVEHLPAKSGMALDKPTDALTFLRETKKRYHRCGNESKSGAITQSLDGIYRLTHAKKTELNLRSSELLAAQAHHTLTLPKREVLEHWLRQQADAAVGSELEHRYFTELANTNLSESDPWTISQQLVRSLPSAGDAEQVARLRAAHNRLVRVMACGLSGQPLSSSEQHLPDGFRWHKAYGAVQRQCEFDSMIGDIYAAAASSSALREIDHAVSMAYEMHCQSPQRSSSEGVAYRVQALREMARISKKRQNEARRLSLNQSLDCIYLLTHTRNRELTLRDEEFRTASFGPHAQRPDRGALGKWLRKQIDAVHGTDLERRYFTELAEANREERDPWTVSQQLVRSLPTPGNAGQAGQLQAAHRHLVRAMANDQLEEPQVSSAWEPPEGFNWQSTYRAIQSQCWTNAATGDSFTAAASASALREIEWAVAAAYATHAARIPRYPPTYAADKLHALRGMRLGALRLNHPARAEAVDKSLKDIYRLTHAKKTELQLRSDELPESSLNPRARRPDREALGRWLRQQAAAAQVTGLERRYFTELAQEIREVNDPRQSPASLS